MTTRPKPSLPAVFCESATKDYYREDNRGGYIRVKKECVKTYLKSLGYSPIKDDKELISDLDAMLLRIQTEHPLDFVGSLAGHPAGFRTTSKLNLLVTQSPASVTPAPGQWPLIKQVGENLFGPIQWLYVLSWLKLSLVMMLTGLWQAGQAFVMCGAKGAGKNLFTQFIKMLLGGRAADPYQYMTGVTSFNHDIFGAELLIIEDKAESINIQARRAFGAAIKNITVNENQRYHRQYGDPILLNPIWRIVISLNDDPERLLVLPPIDPDIDDKMMVFKVFKHPMPMPTKTGAQQKAFETAWMAEIPAFAHFLQEWEIPAQLQCDRFGVEVSSTLRFLKRWKKPPRRTVVAQLECCCALTSYSCSCSCPLFRARARARVRGKIPN